MIRAEARKFTADEDALIKQRWTHIKSSAIGALMTPPRNGSAIRRRAQRLGLPHLVAEAFKARPGNQNRKRRRPGVVPLRCLNSNIDGMPLFDPRVVAADFIRWREARA